MAASVDLDWWCTQYRATFDVPEVGYSVYLDPLGILPCFIRYDEPAVKSARWFSYWNQGAPDLTNYPRPGDSRTPFAGQYFLPPARPVCAQLTDSMILTMDPGKLLEIYYTLGMHPGCEGAQLHREFCPNNKWANYWWKYIPPDSDSGALQIAATEATYRRHIYQMRPDLRTIQTPEGPIPGLYELPTKIVPATCESGWWEVAQWIGTAVGALVPFSWPIAIANFAATAAIAVDSISDVIRAAKDQRELVDKILRGARSIGGQSLLDSLVRSGKLTDRLLFEEAVSIPATRRAWELALIVGLPHPAMICRRFDTPGGCRSTLGQDLPCDRACTPLEIELLLADAITTAHRRARIEMQAAMESELQGHATPFLLVAGRLPDVDSALGGLAGSYRRPNGDPMTGLFPVLVERDGKQFFVTAAMQGEPQRLVAVDQLTDIPATRRWLAWRTRPDLLPSNWVVTAARLVAESGKPAEAATVSASAPANVFQGIFNTPAASNPVDRLTNTLPPINGELPQTSISSGYSLAAMGTSADGGGLSGPLPLLLLAGAALWWMAKK